MPKIDPIQDMHAAKAELRALQREISLGNAADDKAQEQADALHARIARGERAYLDRALAVGDITQHRYEERVQALNASTGTEGGAPAPPSLQALRDDLAALEAEEAETHRAEQAGRREKALERWASTRSSLLRALAGQAERQAARLVVDEPFSADGLADLLAATSPEYDKKMRAAIESSSPHIEASQYPSGRVRQIQELRRQIGVRESEGRLTPAQERQQRTGGLTIPESDPESSAKRPARGVIRPTVPAA